MNQRSCSLLSTVKYLPEWFPGTAWKKFGVSASFVFHCNRLLARVETEGG
jgi:hypothetical protein